MRGAAEAGAAGRRVKGPAYPALPGEERSPSPRLPLSPGLPREDGAPRRSGEYPRPHVRRLGAGWGCHSRSSDSGPPFAGRPGRGRPPGRERREGERAAWGRPAEQGVTPGPRPGDRASLCLQGESGEPGPKGQVSPAPAAPPSSAATFPLGTLLPRALPLPPAPSHPGSAPTLPRSKECAENPATAAPAETRAPPGCKATPGPRALEDWLETAACPGCPGGRAWR